MARPRHRAQPGEYRNRFLPELRLLRVPRRCKIHPHRSWSPGVCAADRVLRWRIPARNAIAPRLALGLRCRATWCACWSLQVEEPAAPNAARLTIRVTGRAGFDQTTSTSISESSRKHERLVRSETTRDETGRPRRNVLACGIP